MSKRLWLMFSVVVVGLWLSFGLNAASAQTPTPAPPTGDWHVIWEWTADADGAYQPLRAGAVYAVDGGIDHIALDGSASSGSTVRFDNLLLTPQSNNLRITIQYRTVSNASPRLRFGNPADTADFCQPTSGQFPIGQSSPWVTTTFDFSLCSLVVDQDYLFSLRNVGTSSDKWLVRSVTIESFFYIPPPPPPPPPTAPLSPVCFVVVDSSNAVITSTANITATYSITGTVHTVSSDLVRNGGFANTSDGVVPLHWSWSQPFAVGGMWVNDVGGYGKIIRRNGGAGGAVPMALDESPEMVGDSLTAAGTTIEVTQRLTVPYAPSYRLSADFRQDGAGLVVALGTGQLAPSGVISAFTTISTTTTISPGVKDIRLAFDESTSTVAVDNVSLIPLDESGGVYCPAVAEYWEEQGAGGGGGGGFGGASWSFFGITMGTCLICPRPSWLWTSEAMYFNEFLLWFLYQLFNYFSALFQWIRCGLVNVWTCYLWPILYDFYNFLWVVYAALVNSINLVIAGIQSTINFIQLMIYESLAWLVSLWVGARNILGWMIDGIEWGFVALAQFLVDLAATAVSWAVNILYYALAGAAGAWDFLLLVLGILWAALITLLELIKTFAEIIYAVAMMLWGVLGAMALAMSGQGVGIHEWAATTDLNSVTLSMFFLGIGLVDWSLERLGLVSLMWMTVGLWGMYIAVRMMREWDKIA